MRLFQAIWRAIVRFFSFGLADHEDESAEATRLIDEMRRKLAELKSSAAAAIAYECRVRKLADAAGDDEQSSAEYGAARECAEAAKQRLDEFESELASVVSRNTGARVKYQIAAMRAQLEQFALDHRLDDLDAIERLERKADAAQAEADALRELNAALGGDAGASDDTDERGSAR